MSKNNDEFLKKEYKECILRLDREKLSLQEYNPTSTEVMESRKRLTRKYIQDKAEKYETLEGIEELDLSESKLCVFEETQDFNPSELCL